MVWTSTPEGFREDEVRAEAGCRVANRAVHKSRSEKLLLLSKLDRGDKIIVSNY